MLESPNPNYDEIKKMFANKKYEINSYIKKILEWLNIKEKFDINISLVDQYFEFDIIRPSTNNQIIDFKSFKNKSSGIKRLIVLGLIIFFVCKNNKKMKILLIDEPETYLNLLFQTNFMNFLTELQKEKEIHKTYILYTTHSPYLVNRNCINEIHQVRRNNIDYQTKIFSYFDVIDNEYSVLVNERKIDPIFYFYGNNQHQYNKFKYILFVEGKADIDFIYNKIINKYLNDNEYQNEIKDKLDEIFIMCFYGSNIYDELEYVQNNLSHFFKNKTIYFLFDDDYAGRKMSKVVKEKCYLDENHIKLYSYFSVKYNETNKEEHISNFRKEELENEMFDKKKPKESHDKIIKNFIEWFRTW